MKAVQSNSEWLLTHMSHRICAGDVSNSLQKRGRDTVRIRHIMKDGVIRTDLTGHVVRMSEAKTVYSLMDQINRQEGK